MRGRPIAVSRIDRLFAGRAEPEGPGAGAAVGGEVAVGQGEGEGGALGGRVGRFGGPPCVRVAVGHVDAGGDEVAIAVGIEALELPDRWVLAVQWHPEDDDGSKADREALFRALLDG